MALTKKMERAQRVLGKNWAKALAKGCNPTSPGNSGVIVLGKMKAQWEEFRDELVPGKSPEEDLRIARAAVIRYIYLEWSDDK